MEAITQQQNAVIDPAAYVVRSGSPRPASGRWTLGAAAFLLLLVGASYASNANSAETSRSQIPCEQTRNVSGSTK